MDTYDLFVIGSGPAGQKAAIAAAKLGKRVAIADRRPMLGGVALHTGTIPSKTLREAVLYLTGFRQRSFYGPEFTLLQRIHSEDLMFRVSEVLRRQLEVLRRQLSRNGVDVFEGTAHFIGPHALEVWREDRRLRVQATHVLVACGTSPARPADVPFDGVRILDTDQLLQGVRRELPRSVIVVGAGVIGLEYAAMMTALNMEVALVDGRDEILPFVDREIMNALVQALRERGLTVRLSETVRTISQEAGTVVAELAGGRHLRAEMLLYAVGRQGSTESLNLAAAGLEADARGRLAVDERYRTAVPHIYAAGDVIGFPALASTSMEQGRLATCHMFDVPVEETPRLLPYGIYAIPEIAMVGRTEEDLRRQGQPYEVGLARFAEIAKAQMIGDETGMLKLLFDPVRRSVLGVHILGEGATELLHIGQVAMALGGTLDFLAENVFNYPTLAEAYRVAAINGLNKLGAVKGA
jgi:NAD(P) transhydrogenase